MSARLQVNISEEMMTKVDEYCRKLGVTRSAFCAVLIGQGLAGFDAAFGIVGNVSEQMTKKILSEVDK